MTVTSRERATRSAVGGASLFRSGYCRVRHQVDVGPAIRLESYARMIAPSIFASSESL